MNKSSTENSGSKKDEGNAKSVEVEPATSEMTKVYEHESIKNAKELLGIQKSELISNKDLGPKFSESRKGRINTGKNILGSTIDIRKSLNPEAFDRKAARYMNTYKLDADNPFDPEKVDKILRNTMTEALENLTYDKEKCLKQAKWASMQIRSQVKELEFDRYKIICVVTIGEKNSQDIFVACRFLWDADRDRYSFYSLENTHVFGIAQCFGIYYE